VRRVIEEALRLSPLPWSWFTITHPAIPEPSVGDDDVTRDLLKACKLVQLVLLDHVIVGESGALQLL
jgi:DNA repair protein RadC